MSGEAIGVATENAKGKWNVTVEAHVDGSLGWYIEAHNKKPLASANVAKAFALAVVNRMDVNGDIPEANKKWRVVVYAGDGPLED